MKHHNENVISELCGQADCNPKRRKLHRDQVVMRAWNPHPSQAFIAWWSKHPECQQGIDAIRARNCRIYVDQFREAREYGLESEVIHMADEPTPKPAPAPEPPPEE